MKKILGKLCLGGVFLFSLSMSLTSCEGALDDILGEWSRPTPGGGSSSDETTPTMMATPLTLEVLTDGTIVVNNPQAGMQYSLNGGDKTAVTATAIDVAVGDKVAFYGNGTSISTYSDGTTSTTFGGTAEVKVYGNIMSLVDETGFEDNKTLTGDYTFANLFNGYANLKDASGLLLPAETLTGGCYAYMFLGCLSLTTAPALPAETLTEACYYGMFEACSSLTTAPALPAETLTEGCYYEMFAGCSSLTTAPKLPATTLVYRCYIDMFNGCSKLSSVTCLATDISTDACTTDWLSGVAATGTFTKASGVDWSGKTGAAGIPSGWTVIEK